MPALKKIAKSPVLHILLWLAPLVAVIWWGSKQESPQWPDTGSEWAWLVSALAAYAVATLMRGERWHSILGAAKVEVGRGDAYGLTVVGYAGNNALPARGGELLRIFLLSSRTGAKRRTVIGSILAERILDALALGTILLVVAYDLVKKLSTSPVLVFAGLGAAVVLALALAYVWWRHRHHALRLVDAVRPMVTPLKPLLGVKGVLLLLLSFAIWGVESAVYGMVAESVGIHLGVTGSMSVVAFANLAALIPAAPGSIGTWDAAVAVATRAVTKTKVNPLSFILLLRFVVYVPITVVGMALLFLRYGGLARLKAARAAASSDADGEVGGSAQAEPVEPVEATA